MVKQLITPQLLDIATTLFGSLGIIRETSKHTQCARLVYPNICYSEVSVWLQFLDCFKWVVTGYLNVVLKCIYFINTSYKRKHAYIYCSYLDSLDKKVDP